MDLSRRTFFKIAGVAGAAGVVGRPAPVAADTRTRPDARAMLVDTTRCIGCRGCEAACAEANGLPGRSDEPVAGTRRVTDPKMFTVVNAFAPTGDGEAEARDRDAGRALHGFVQRSSHAITSAYQRTEFCGLRTQ